MCTIFFMQSYAVSLCLLVDIFIRESLILAFKNEEKIEHAKNNEGYYLDPAVYL